MLEAASQHLRPNAIQIATGTTVNATIIHAPSSTKNKSGERDPEMHRTRKGSHPYFPVGIYPECLAMSFDATPGAWFTRNGGALDRKSAHMLRTTKWSP